MGIILIPLMLIILDSVFNTILTLNGDASLFSILGEPFIAFITAAAPILAFLGEPFVALLIATVKLSKEGDDEGDQESHASYQCFHNGPCF